MRKKYQAIFDEAKAKLEVVRKEAAERDWESAHGEQDELYEYVLEVIAEGFPYSKELAALALETQDIVKVKWWA